MELSFKTIEPEGLDDVLELFKKAAEKIHEKKVDHWQYWHNPPASKVEWVKDGIASGEFKFIIANDHLNV
ncbi:MAG: GNAT family N-acetyltransferase, partial [Bacteroidota bacterium]